jgi:hypothetical protein
MLANFNFQGGHIEDSPSGRYCLMIFAPMDETAGGTYDVTLKDKSTGHTLRSATITLGSNEKTRSLRGFPVSMKWDASESYSDIVIDGEVLIRISVPTKAD